MITSIGCVVEGQSDVAAVPILLRRMSLAIAGREVRVPRPVRVPRGLLMKPDELERAVVLAALNAGAEGAVLVLVDADTDCPATLGPSLLARAQARLPSVPLAVVLAKHEFESWFLAAAISLRGKRGLPADLQAPDEPESVRGAKEWLRDRMPRDRRYRETLDQPALCAHFDLAAARSANSFEKCYRDVERLLNSPLPDAGEPFLS